MSSPPRWQQTSPAPPCPRGPARRFDCRPPGPPGRRQGLCAAAGTGHALAGLARRPPCLKHPVAALSCRRSPPCRRLSPSPPTDPKTLDTERRWPPRTKTSPAPCPTSPTKRVPAVAGVLDWVGHGRDRGAGQRGRRRWRRDHQRREVNAFVNLKRPDARGIHMSRLYLHVDKALSGEPISPASMRRLLKDFLDSHADLSDRAMIEHQLRLPRAAPGPGQRQQRLEVLPGARRGDAGRTASSRWKLGVDVAYSSTCPCSAALARQLIQEQFSQDFAAGEAAGPRRGAGLAGQRAGHPRHPAQPAQHGRGQGAPGAVVPEPARSSRSSTASRTR